jgi:NAD(P)-dependent dehydrogenase (short-subunit alcohol dehydrogenase family)
MGQDYSPPHGFTVNGAFTSSVYRDVYQAVDPKRPELSQKGKVVIVTGASRGVGVGIAEAVAKAGAKAIIITARKPDTLADTEATIRRANPSTEVLRVALEITDESSVAEAFKTIAQNYPTLDVLINNAGIYFSAGQFLSSADTSKWWGDVDVNVRGTMLVTRAFLSLLKSDQKATVINLTSGAGLLTVPGSSGYSFSKLLGIAFTSYLAAENPNVQTVAVHPGIVATDMGLSSDMFSPYAKDTKELSGAVVNWAASAEASFLNGRYLSINWDVAELKARKEEIVSKNQLVISLGGQVAGSVAALKASPGR